MASSRPDEKREKFGKAVGEVAADPQALAHTCSAIRKIGYPTYYPEYMVLHGIHAFTGFYQVKTNGGIVDSKGHNRHRRPELPPILS
jgi:hypothetical protein